MSAVVSTIEELRQRRILRDQEDTIELEPVGPGEVQVSVLTDDERELYVNFVHAASEFEEANAEISARSIENLAQTVRASGKIEKAEVKVDYSLFGSPEEAEAFLETEARFAFLRAHFSYVIKARLGFAAVYGVRRGFIVVRVADLYTHGKSVVEEQH